MNRNRRNSGPSGHSQAFPVRVVVILLSLAVLFAGTALLAAPTHRAASPSPAPPPMTMSGEALDFDGVNDSVDIGNLPFNGLSALTVEAWVKFNALTDGGHIFGKAGSGNEDIEFTLGGSPYPGDNNDLVAWMGENPGTGIARGFTTSNVVSPGVWMHAAFVFDGSGVGNANRMKIYVNGVPQSLSFTGTFPATTPITTANAFLGARFTTQFFMNGQLDEVRIWTAARTQAQIQSAMNSELAGTDSGLLAYYKFNQGIAGGNNAGVTTAFDSGPNGFNGTLNNFTLNGSTSNWVAPGGVALEGAALNFDGTNDHVSVPSLASAYSSTFTIEAWVRPEIISATNFHNFAGWGKNGSNTDVALFRTANALGNFQFGQFNGSTFSAVNSSSTLTVNQWQHVAVVKEGMSIRLYLNGALDGSGTLTNTVSGLNTFAIGAALRTGIQYQFDGNIDEVRIWSVARSACEIQAQKDCELSGTETGLVAYYKFNQGIAGGNNAGETIAIDSSPNGFNGTLNNFALNGATSNWVAPGGVTTGVSCAVPNCNQSPDCSGAMIADQSADANCQATISAADVTGITDPDNDTVTITVNPTILSLGSNSVTVTADDGNGGSCSTTITVNVTDNTPPQINSLPADASYQCASQVPAGNPSQATASDNCSTATIAVSDSSNGGGRLACKPARHHQNFHCYGCGWK